MSNLQRAIALATEKHADQRDKLGAPYVDHLRRVADRLTTDREKTVAWLHDILEDTDTSPEDLAKEGFPEEIVQAVAALTKLEEEPYEHFVRRAGRNPLARRVKLADLADNSDEERLGRLAQDDADRLREKYLGARAHLNDPGEKSDR